MWLLCIYSLWHTSNRSTILLKMGYSMLPPCSQSIKLKIPYDTICGFLVDWIENTASLLFQFMKYDVSIHFVQYSTFYSFWLILMCSSFLLKCIHIFLCIWIFFPGSISNIEDEDSNYRCEDGSSPEIKKQVISGVVAAASSVTSIQVANLLKLFKIPQVSFE